MTHLAHRPEEDPVMVSTNTILLVLVMGRLQVTFADCSLQDLGLGPR